MSWLSRWFSKDIRSQLLNIVVQITIAFLGRIGTELWVKIREEVQNAENSGATGPKKFELVYKAVKDWLKNQPVGENLLRFLIESAVLVMNYKTI